MPRDGGYQGQIRSLGGLTSKPGKGLQTTLTRGTLTIGVVFTVMPSNPGRVWAIISNDDTADYLSVALGENPTAPTHQLLPGGSFKIDSLTPWTGDVRIVSGQDCLYSCTEASIEGF